MSGRLELRDVTVLVGSGRGRFAAVDAVDLEVPAGEVVGLVGESGCGKSTLARAVVGLVPLAGGSVRLDGAGLGARQRWRRAPRGPSPVQLIFQDAGSALDPRMTVGDSIAEALPRVRGRRRRGNGAEIARLLEQVSLDPGHAGQLPRELSGGQRQRVTIARALAARPQAIVADEITSALDASVQGAVLNLIREIRRELGVTMLFISHNLAVVRYVADEIAVMHDGRIVEAAATDALIAAPRDAYTRQLLGSVPSLQRPATGASGA